MLNGTLVKEEWYLLKKIGEGAFGEIYSARNVITNKMAAIKLERVDSKKQVLKLEVAALKRLQSCPHVTKLLTCGKFRGHTKEWNYMVMDLFGENLSELRKQQPNGIFDMITTLRLGIRFVSLIEDVHEKGYVHRDVKPSNFVVGLSGEKRRNIYMIDFGLARRYMSSEGQLRLERDCAGFRGTTRYASINSHLGKDLSRRDDLWSIFYILLEFSKGSLPWRRLKDKDKVGEMKASLSSDFLSGLPSEFGSFLDHLETLQFEDKPNYNLLRDILYQALTATGGDDNCPFPWEIKDPPVWSMEVLPTATTTSRTLSERTEISTTNTPSRDYSRGGTADLMATTSDSHEKSDFLYPKKDSGGSVTSPRRSSPSVMVASLSDSNRSSPPNKYLGVTAVVGGDCGCDIAEGKGTFVELDASEKSKEMINHLQTTTTTVTVMAGRRRATGLKSKSKDSSKSASKKKKKSPSNEQQDQQQQQQQQQQQSVPKCGCNLL